MKLLVLTLTLAAAVTAAPQGYNLPVPSGPGLQGCGQGEVVNVDGSCAVPVVTRHVYVYTPPAQPTQSYARPQIPAPKIDYNVVFIRAPDQPQGADPIIIPPPRQQSVVYVLSKRPEQEGQRIIQVPGQPPQSPQVYFVNYGPNENPTLPGGVDLSSALSSAIHSGPGQAISGGGGGGGQVGYGSGPVSGAPIDFGAVLGGSSVGPTAAPGPVFVGTAASAGGAGFGGAGASAGGSGFGGAAASAGGAGFGGAAASAGGSGFSAGGAGFGGGSGFSAGGAGFGGGSGFGAGGAGAGFGSGFRVGLGFDSVEDRFDDRFESREVLFTQGFS